MKGILDVARDKKEKDRNEVFVKNSDDIMNEMYIFDIPTTVLKIIRPPRYMRSPKSDL